MVCAQIGSNNDSQDTPVFWKFLTIISHPTAFVQPNKPALKLRRLWLTTRQNLLPCDPIVGVDFSILTRAAVEQTALQVINVRKVPPAPALQAGAARVQ